MTEDSFVSFGRVAICFGLIVSVRIETRLCFFREDGNIAIGPIQEEEMCNGNGIR